MMEQGNDCERILFTAEDIAAQVKKAAAWLDERFEGTVPLAVSVLKGSVIFFCDLVRAIEDARADGLHDALFLRLGLLIFGHAQDRDGPSPRPWRGGTCCSSKTL